MRRRATTATLTFVSFIALLGACSGTEDGLPQTNGGAGGAQSSGGTTSGTGGALSTGGSSSGAGGSSGGVSASGGTTATGGSTGGSESAGTGGTNVAGTSGGGGAGAGGAGSGGGGAAGTSSAGSSGDAGAGGTSGTAGSGGDGGGTAGASNGGSGGGGGSGTCTPSSRSGGKASGSGPHDVVIETNSDDGINEGTIFRPAELGGAEKYPIFVWGEGGCSRNGLSNQSAMAEIASHGYFVIADGTPNGSEPNRPMDASNIPGMAEPLLAYIDWAVAENAKPCSEYYQALDATKIAANGFSCGGLMAEGTAGDPRMTTWGITSSGMFSENQALYDSIHTPVLILLGGPSDSAYANGSRDYDNISELGVPVVFLSKDIGHGGDLFQSGGGDFTKINLAWINWWLKGDETATGKGMLVGASCPYCNDSEWEYDSANVP